MFNFTLLFMPPSLSRQHFTSLKGVGYSREDCVEFVGLA